MTSNLPLVSIITPSFNQARYLEDTIRSVLGQDYPRVEYSIIDGASSDGSVDIIRKYADKLTWWVSEKDSGQAEAINKGFVRAQGEIVAWLNSDDTYLPEAISAAVKAFQKNPDVVLVYGNLLAIDEHGQTINLLNYNQLSLKDLLCFQIIGQPAVFFRREALEKVGNLDITYHFSARSPSLAAHSFAGTNPSCRRNLGCGALSSRSQEPRESGRVWARSLPYFGLGQD